MTCSCRRLPKIWASWRDPEGKAVVVNLKLGEAQAVGARTFALHLGPLVTIDAVIDAGITRIELREIAMIETG